MTAGAIAIGAAAGVIAGMLGVGGGVLFVPGLVFLVGLGQHEAEATSLLAIIPVAIVGSYQQDRYGNVRRRDALLLGLTSIAGAAAGVIAGMLGVGGGVLFVPGLVFLVGLGQHEAEATSLLAIIPVAIVGSYQQDRYGNVRRRDALLLGLTSVAGATAGVALANAVSGAVLRDAFALFMVLVAAQLVRRALRDPD
jgi:uncharacterized membrane protein YfcA